MKRVLIVAMLAVVFLAAACESSAPDTDLPDVTVTVAPEPDIDPELETIASLAFNQLEANERVVVCALVTDGVDESEIDSFMDGTSGGFTRDDARQILEYTGEVLCV